MRRARIVIASRLFTPEVGAAAFRLQALADGLTGRGARVTVLTTTPPEGSTLPSTRTEETVSRFPVLRDAGGNVRGYLQYLSFDIPLFFRLLFTRADLVISEPPPTTGAVVAITSWLRRRPYVYYAADVWTEALAAIDAPGPITRLMRAVEGFALRNAARVLAVSDDVATKVGEFDVDRARIVTVGNGVDTGIFSPAAEPAAHNGPTFVYSGTMSEWQGVDLFIKAMPAVLAHRPNARLLLIGQGSAEAELRNLAARIAPDAVEFGGVVPPASAASALRAATAALVSIVPGQGYDFAKPTKIYAAAACGTPVIFAGTGAGAQLVREASLGYAVTYDEDAVTAGMIRALDDATSNASEAARAARASWAHDNASLAAAGHRAASAVIDVLRPRLGP